jgi:pectate lyase
LSIGVPFLAPARASLVGCVPTRKVRHLQLIAIHKIRSYLHNVIITHVTLDDGWPYWETDSEGSDAIAIARSTDIWIHRCDFSQWIDGAIDISSDYPGDPHNPGIEATVMSERISVTWSRFARIHQALNWRADRISFGHNLCDRVAARSVQILAGAVHSYNNVIARWSKEEIQNAKDGAQLYSMRNNSSSRRATP